MRSSPFVYAVAMLVGLRVTDITNVRTYGTIGCSMQERVVLALRLTIFAKEGRRRHFAHYQRKCRDEIS